MNVVIAALLFIGLIVLIMSVSALLGGLFIWFVWNLLAPVFGVSIALTYWQAVAASFGLSVLGSYFRKG